MYLFIAYKPYSSSFITNNNLTRTELIEVWGEIIVKNEQRYYEEAEYEVRIYDNGVEVWGEYGATCDKNFDNDPDGKLEDVLKENITKIHDEASIYAFSEIEKEKEKERLKAEQKKLEQEKASREYRKKQYELLKKEFE